MHDPFAARGLVQPFELRLKSPANVGVENVSAAVPVFVSVMACALLLVPMFWEGKTRFVGDRLTIGKGVTPVPLRVMVRGLPVAVSVMVIAPERVPVAVGLKVIEMTQ